MITENFSHNLEEPPEFGELTMSFSLEPVSLQSKTAKKDFVKNKIRNKTRTLNYYLSGDVKIEIQWLVYEQERYESADSPDMDNIIKPILDGLSGPDGLLIDDCQVQTIGSHWVDWVKKEHAINIYVRYIPDEFFKKDNLVFVNMGKNLFIPFHTDLPDEANMLLLEHLEMRFKLKDQILEKTDNYYQAKMFAPIQRVFHKSRIHGTFQTLEFDTFKNSLKASEH